MYILFIPNFLVYKEFEINMNKSHYKYEMFFLFGKHASNSDLDEIFPNKSK